MHTDAKQLAALFDALPTCLFVIDRLGRVLDRNAAAIAYTGYECALGETHLCGSVLGCARVVLDRQQCGSTSACPECPLRACVAAALETRTTSRRKGRMELVRDGKLVRAVILFTSVPMPADGDDRTLVAIEDITELETLRALIPMCASCKSVRNDRGEWTRVEAYISAQAGSEVTHGLCPACLERLYPDLASELWAPSGDTEG